MTRSAINRLAHLELQTTDPARACAFLTTMFGWRAEAIRVGDREYLGIDLGARIEGGVVRRDIGSPWWLPYVEVDDIVRATMRARTLGASVVLPPREGPVGWRSILVAPAGGEIALWQPKR
jgi:predicted enzyme related to lactoylglutathione lyase